MVCAKEKKRGMPFFRKCSVWCDWSEGSFKGTRIAGEVGEKQGSVYEHNVAEEFEFYLEVRGAMEGIKLNF